MLKGSQFGRFGMSQVRRSQACRTHKYTAGPERDQGVRIESDCDSVYCEFLAPGRRGGSIARSGDEDESGHNSGETDVSD